MLRFVIKEHPDAHPYESEKADDNECHFPTQMLGQQWNCQWSKQCADRCARIENRRCISSVFLRKILSRGLDCSREIACFTKCENTSGHEKTIHAHSANQHSRITHSLNHLRRVMKADNRFCHDTTQSMSTCSCRPDSNSPQIAFASSHPVHEFPCEKHTDSIDYGKNRSYSSIM